LPEARSDNKSNQVVASDGPTETSASIGGHHESHHFNRRRNTHRRRRRLLEQQHQACRLAAAAQSERHSTDAAARRPGSGRWLTSRSGRRSGYLHAQHGFGPSSSSVGGKYTVKAGDTLFRIAATHYGSGKEWKKIAAANPGLDPKHLRVGQKITLP
jgi:nucleoid-associated protein YgaU